jgi:hypothetical protein
MAVALGRECVFAHLLQSLASTYIMSCPFADINPAMDDYIFPPVVPWPVGTWRYCVIPLAMIIGDKSIRLLFARSVNFSSDF